MRREHVGWLCCPTSREPLSLEVDEEAQDGHILTGTLYSAASRYRIEGGIPRFLMEERSEAESRTADAFGKQWAEAGVFSLTYGQDEDYFDQFFHPLSLDSLRDRITLDAGCGNGRLLELVLRYDPALIVGLDYSSSVEIAFRRTRHADHVLIVQGSILAPPLAERRFEVIFSLGVVHHLASPSVGVERLGGLLKEQGKMHLWTYAREGNELYLAVAGPMRRLSRRLPARALWGFSFALALAGWPYLLLCSASERWLRGRHPLPMSRYLAFLYSLGFRVFALVIHDQLAPAIAHYPRRSELLEWCRKPSLTVNHLDMRTENSWRIGLVKESSS